MTPALRSTGETKTPTVCYASTALKAQGSTGEAEREAVARHLLTQGLPVEAEQILIVSEVQHGLTAIAMGLFRPGDVIGGALHSC